MGPTKAKQARPSSRALTSEQALVTSGRPSSAGPQRITELENHDWAVVLSFETPPDLRDAVAWLLSVNS